MNESEKEAAERLVKAIESLPDAKKEWVLGYAEGLADAKKAQQEKTA